MTRVTIYFITRNHEDIARIIAGYALAGHMNINKELTCNISEDTFQKLKVEADAGLIKFRNK